MEIIAAVIICQVGGADPSEGHRAQLGLNGIINSMFFNSGLIDLLEYVYGSGNTLSDPIIQLLHYLF